MRIRCDRRMAVLTMLAALPLGLFLIHCGSDKPTEPNTYPKPVITVAPAVSDITDATVTIAWTTDIQSSTVVLYGFSSGRLIFRDSSYVSQTRHSTLLGNLVSNTIYYYVVQSTAKGGTVRSEELTFRTGLGLMDLGPAGWAEYEKGNFQTAMAYFKALYGKLPTSAEALNGLGWCYAHSSVDSLTVASSYFANAILQKVNFTDAMTGLGFVNLALKKYGPCIDNLTRVLSLAPNYKFSHDAKITSRTLRIGLAEAYFNIQAFSSAQAQLDLLEPGNGLNPASAATWVVNGALYGTYAEALLAWIEKLKV